MSLIPPIYKSFNLYEIWSDNGEPAYAEAFLNINFKIQINDTVTSMTVTPDWSRSNFRVESAPGKTGGGFVNMIGICWGGVGSHYGWYPDSNTRHNLNYAWETMYDTIPNLDNYLIWGCAIDDGIRSTVTENSGNSKGVSVKRNNSSYTFKLNSSQDIISIPILYGIYRSLQSDNDPPYPNRPALCDCKYEGSVDINRDDLSIPYYPGSIYSENDHNFHSCNRREGYFKKFEKGLWRDQKNELALPSPNTVFIRKDNQWSRSPLIGIE